MLAQHLGAKHRNRSIMLTIERPSTSAPSGTMRGQVASTPWPWAFSHVSQLLSCATSDALTCRSIKFGFGGSDDRKMDAFGSSLGSVASPPSAMADIPLTATVYECKVTHDMVDRVAKASRHFGPQGKKIVAGVVGGAVAAGMYQKQAQNRFRENLLTPVGVFAAEVSDKGLRLQAARGTRPLAIEWAQFDEWLEARDFLVLSAKGRAVILPKAALPPELIAYVTETCHDVVGQGLLSSGLTRSATAGRHRAKVGIVAALLAVAMFLVAAVALGGQDTRPDQRPVDLGACEFTVVQADGTIVCR